MNFVFEICNSTIGWYPLALEARCIKLDLGNKEGEIVE
jgi:hypothetical protein